MLVVVYRPDRPSPRKWVVYDGEKFVRAFWTEAGAKKFKEKCDGTL